MILKYISSCELNQISTFYYYYCVDISAGGLLVPEGIIRTVSTFYYYYCVDTSAGGLLVPEGIIRTVISASALTRFLRYIYY